MSGRNGDYGYDGSFHTVSAGAQMAVVGAGSAALLTGAVVGVARGNRLAAAIAAGSAAEMLATAASYIYATRSGKFHVWNRVLDDLRLRGDETLLDMGCGRGAVLLSAAKRLPRGRAIGVDLWRADQTDNSQDATLVNAAAGKRRRSRRAAYGRHDRVAVGRRQRRRDREQPGHSQHPDASRPAKGAGRGGPRAPAGRAARHRRPVGDPAACRAGYGSWAGETWCAATSDGACGTAVRGSPRAWSPPRSPADIRRTSRRGRAARAC